MAPVGELERSNEAAAPKTDPLTRMASRPPRSISSRAAVRATGRVAGAPFRLRPIATASDQPILRMGSSQVAGHHS